jgi:tetratricopeptide (TPR) repeat protein
MVRCRLNIIALCFAALALLMSVNAQPGLADGRASTNDNELKALFNDLAESETALSAEKITRQIWTIWIDDASSDSSRSVMERGIKLMNEGRLEAAEKLFSNLILQQPDYIEAWNKRATVRFMMGQLDASLEDVFVVLSKEPKHFGAVSGLAMILMREKNFGGALQAYRKVLQIHPFSGDALRLIPILEQRILGERI